MPISEVDISEQPADKSLIKKVWWRVMPLILVTYLISVIDKMNVSFAKLDMVQHSGLTETAYGFASSLFFIGYLMFEIPSALAVHRYGAPKWFFRIILSWGIATLMIAYFSSGSAFAALRFLVGAAEAGLYPGIVYYLTLWFPRKYQIRALAVVTLASALGNMLGSLFGGFLLSLDGLLGYAGWQWVFIATGLPALLIAPLVLTQLPRNISEARFLKPEEGSRLQELVAAQQINTHHHGSVMQVLRDPIVLMLAAGYTLLLTSLYGVIYWLPTVIKSFGVSSTLNGFLNMVPWAVTCVLLLTLPKALKKDSHVQFAATVIGMIGCCSFILSTLLTDPVWRYVALAIGTPCTSLLLPCFWSQPSKYFSGRRAATSLAAISCIGNFGGFLAQNLMPQVGKLFGHPNYAMLLPAACLLSLSVIAIVMQYNSRRSAMAASTL